MASSSSHLVIRAGGLAMAQRKVCLLRIVETLSL
jgi:hypothetical protein